MKNISKKSKKYENYAKKIEKIGKSPKNQKKSKKIKKKIEKIEKSILVYEPGHPWPLVFIVIFPTFLFPIFPIST